jgi:hypothetical protein
MRCLFNSSTDSVTFPSHGIIVAPQGVAFHLIVTFGTDEATFPLALLPRRLDIFPATYIYRIKLMGAANFRQEHHISKQEGTSTPTCVGKLLICEL